MLYYTFSSEELQILSLSFCLEEFENKDAKKWTIKTNGVYVVLGAETWNHFWKTSFAITLTTVKKIALQIGVNFTNMLTSSFLYEKYICTFLYLQFSFVLVYHNWKTKLLLVKIMLPSLKKGTSIKIVIKGASHFTKNYTKIV